MRRVDKERGNIRRVHTKEWKHEKSQQMRKRNEKHKCKNEDDQNGNLNREIFLLAKNTKNEIKCLEKKESVFENVENNENEAKKRDILLKEIENRRKMAKTKQA